MFRQCNTIPLEYSALLLVSHTYITHWHAKLQTSYDARLWNRMWSVSVICCHFLWPRMTFIGHFDYWKLWRATLHTMSLIKWKMYSLFVVCRQRFASKIDCEKENQTSAYNIAARKWFLFCRNFKARELKMKFKKLPQFIVDSILIFINKLTCLLIYLLTYV